MSTPTIPGNGYAADQRLIADFMRRQEAHNERVLERLEEVNASLTELRTQRSLVAWVLGPSMGALAALALRKFGL